MNITKFDPLIDYVKLKVLFDIKHDLRQIFLHVIEKHNECLYIARYDNEIAGFLSLNRFNTERVDLTIYIDEKYRRKGIGTGLLRFSDRFISNSTFEYAYCEFTADEGAAEFMTKNGYRSYCRSFDMERENALIDSDKLNDISLLERGIIIRNYRDDDYIAWHNISDIAFFLLREKLCLTPSYYLPLSETERRRLANDCTRRYVMIVDCVTTAVGAINNNTVHLLAVRPDLQQRGYGEILLSYLINLIITKQNPEKVKIGVLDGNPAKKLYEKLGFREVTYKDEYIKYYRPDSRPEAPKGYANKDKIMNALRLDGMLKEEMIP